MFLCRSVFYLYHSAPEGAAVVYINNSHISSSGLHYMSMGHACLICTHLYIISHLVEGRIYRFLSSPTDCSIRSHSCSPLQHHSQEKKHWWISAIRFAPNLIHQGASVITEISSAQGDKELCIISIEKQSFMAQGLTPQHIKRAKTIQSWLKNWKAHCAQGKQAHARIIFVHQAHMRGCGVKNPRACQTVHLWSWSASQPLLDRLPSRFDIKSELNLRREAGQRPKGALKSPFSHSKGGCTIAQSLAIKSHGWPSFLQGILCIVMLLRLL